MKKKNLSKYKNKDVKSDEDSDVDDDGFTIIKKKK